MKRIALFAALATAPVLASAQTTVYDSIHSSGSSLIITTTSTPRTSFGFNVNDIGGGLLDTINFGFRVAVGSPTFDARYRIWKTTDWAALDTTSALSDVIFSKVFSFSGLGAGSYTTGDMDVSADNFLLPNGNIGISIEFFKTGSTTDYVANDGVTARMQTAGELIGTHADEFVRDGDTTGTPSGVFMGEDIRNFGPPYDHAVFATRLRVTPVPEPSAIGAYGLGMIGLLLRRRRR